MSYGSAPPLQQQLRERLALRVRRCIVLAFAGDSAQRCIAGWMCADLEKVIRVRAVVQQDAGNGDRVVAGRCERKSSVAHVEQRRPQLLAFTNLPPSNWAAGFDGRSGPLGQNALDFFQIPAHYSRVNAVARDLRIPVQHAQRRPPARRMSRGTVGEDWIGARVCQKRRHERRVAFGGGRAFVDLSFERGPPRQTVLERERPLYIAQRGNGGSTGKRSVESSARVRGVCAQCAEPPLRFPVSGCRRCSWA